MKIYVAGKWQERHIIRKVMDHLEELGHTITHDWTSHEAAVAPENAKGAVFVYNEWLYKAELTEQALNDVAGVRDADCMVIYAVNAHKYAGTFTEMGVAIRSGIPVYIVGYNLENNIFVNHPLVQVFEDVESLPL